MIIELKACKQVQTFPFVKVWEGLYTFFSGEVRLSILDGNDSIFVGIALCCDTPMFGQIFVRVMIWGRSPLG